MSATPNGAPCGSGRRHIVIVHRWRERYAEYTNYVDHLLNDVTYVTTDIGIAGVPAEAAATVLVLATDDLDEVRARVRELSERFGSPDAIVALKEDDLDVGAALRAEYGCRGQLREAIVAFRDKYVMCSAVRDAGLPLPPFARADDQESVIRFTAEHGWPVIIKPRIGSSSEGVVRIDTHAELAAQQLSDRPRLVQKFVETPIFHVDGYFDGTRLHRWRASRYINTCLGFRAGRFLASVEDDSPDRGRAIGTAASSFLSALTTTPTVFHLELFVKQTGNGKFECSFLEAGARVGGAEIPFLWREVHGFDLMRIGFELQLGEAPAAGDELRTSDVELGGWLLVPAPAARPCRITTSTSVLGLDPGPYIGWALPAGEILPAADAYYEHVGGRFRFRGTSSDAIAAAIENTVQHFRVAAEPLEPVLAAGS